MTKVTENAARRWLETADVTPCGYRVGKFMADRARVATAADVRRKVRPGEIFLRLVPGSGRRRTRGERSAKFKRGVRSLREAGVIQVRRRVQSQRGVVCIHGTGGQPAYRSDPRGGLETNASGRDGGLAYPRHRKPLRRVLGNPRNPRCVRVRKSHRNLGAN